MNDPNLVLKVVFYRSQSGSEPVRDWLKSLSKNQMQQIGIQIKTIQFRWPLGMPLVRKIDTNLWEVRINLDDKIARVLFTVQNNLMILLHSFIKKSQKTPNQELVIAKKRLSNLDN